MKSGSVILGRDCGRLDGKEQGRKAYLCYDERSSDYSTVQLSHYETAHSCVKRKVKVRGPGP